MRARRLTLSLGVAAAALVLPASDARAVDLPKVAGSPVSLDITETSIVAQRFQAREGESPDDQGYFAWLNRLNLVLNWKKLTLGARIDSSVYALRPEDGTFSDAQSRIKAINDGASRYRNAIYPAKLWITYKSGPIEATAGDSYVQFGRGLVLSLRKVDELGLDTTLFGGKITINQDPFAVTLIAGLANPARVDEPTGRALFVTKEIPTLGPSNPEQAPAPLFGSDRIIGAQIQAGRGLPVVASTQAIMVQKCAPDRYDAVSGNAVTDTFDRPIGTCEEPDRSIWLKSLPGGVPLLTTRETVNASQSIEIPNIFKHGNFYVEAAVQRRDKSDIHDSNTDGNAIYGSLVNSGGPITNTLEIKSYRNFYPLVGSVDLSHASAFANVVYSAPPTAELVTQDSEFNAFNVCVTGGRDRFDYRFTPTFLMYGTFAYFQTRGEEPGSSCDRTGKSLGDKPRQETNDVEDASIGSEFRFDEDRSYGFLSATVRNDVPEEGRVYYQEAAIQYSLSKYISGPYSVEIAGRHRLRAEDHENVHGTDLHGEPWREGENQVALKIAPKWVLTQGFEYTTRIGQPTYYVNGGILYKFAHERDNIRIYAGQNRGGLKCVSGICRNFPAFSGARVELTLRF